MSVHCMHITHTKFNRTLLVPLICRIDGGGETLKLNARARRPRTQMLCGARHCRSTTTSPPSPTTMIALLTVMVMMAIGAFKSNIQAPRGDYVHGTAELNVCVCVVPYVIQEHTVYIRLLQACLKPGTIVASSWCMAQARAFTNSERVIDRLGGGGNQFCAPICHRACSFCWPLRCN